MQHRTANECGCKAVTYRLACFGSSRRLCDSVMSVTTLYKHSVRVWGGAGGAGGAGLSRRKGYWVNKFNATHTKNVGTR